MGALARGLRLQKGGNRTIFALSSVGTGRLGAKDIRHGTLYLRLAPAQVTLEFGAGKGLTVDCPAQPFVMLQ
jgi:hypothetical protein